jgi:uncharacterized FAD-dependent dehydrogenase
MIHVEELKTTLSQDERLLPALIAKTLRIPADQIISHRIVKKSIDSRKKSDICFVYTVDVEVVDEKQVLNALLTSKDAHTQKDIKNHRIRIADEAFHYTVPFFSTIPKAPIVVVGSGPCGLFAALALSKAGLSPLIVERGKKTEDRIADVEHFSKRAS